MTYGLNPGLFLENGPAIQAAKAHRAHSASHIWRSLDAQRRFTVVEKALGRPANDDGLDGYPIAL